MAPLTEAQIINDFINDHGGIQGKRSPWQIDKPSRRVSEAPVTYWIYNVSPRKHQISVPPGMPRVLAPCEEGEKYGAPLPIKEITLDYASQGDYKLKAIEIDDIDLVQAIVHPEPGATSDLRIWGVFYSKNNPPTEAELAEAHKRLVATYSNLIKIADTLWEDPKKRQQITGDNGAVYRMAAKEMKIERPWCSTMIEKETCPVCKKGIEKGTARCEFCTAILDWDKALQYRIVTKAAYEEAVADGLIKGKSPKSSSAK